MRFCVCGGVLVCQHFVSHHSLSRAVKSLKTKELSGDDEGQRNVRGSRFFNPGCASNGCFHCTVFDPVNRVWVAPKTRTSKHRGHHVNNKMTTEKRKSHRLKSL